MKANSLLRRSPSSYEKALLVLFFLGLPFIHLVVNGDGVGYYAYLRSPLIDHNFSFSSDWSDPALELEKIFLKDHFIDNPVTKTGHLPNFYSIGHAILWSPFLIVAHLVVLGAGHLGWPIPADGHSWPYLAAMAGATALYGFAGLCFSFAIARRFVEERWAFWATVGIWFATSLPLYLYLLPSWSHAHSVFTNSLFLWYWLRTRGTRSARQWLVLGLMSGLMVDVYQLNVVLMLAVVYEVLSGYTAAWMAGAGRAENLLRLLGMHLGYAWGTLLGMLPSFVTRQIVFGNPFAVGPYTLGKWNWASPLCGQVLISTEQVLIV